MKGSQALRQAKGLRRAANLLTILVILATLLMAASFGYVAYYGNFDREYISRAEAIRVQSQKIAKSAAEAAGGKANAFALLQQSRDELQANVKALVTGNAATRLPAAMSASPQAEKALNEVVVPWQKMRGNVDTILKRRDHVITVGEAALGFDGSVPDLEGLAGELAARLLQINAQRAQIYTAGQLALGAERIARFAGELLQGQTDAPAHLRSANEQFGQALAALREGSSELGIPAVRDATARGYLDDLGKAYSDMSQRMASILARSPDLIQVRQAVAAIFTSSEQLLASADSLTDVYRNLEHERPVKGWFGFAFGGLALFLLALRGIVSWRLTQGELHATEEARVRADEQSSKNQRAIRVLLDEIEGLKEGDLTVQASVGEAFTGAIGDAFNDAIEELRSLATTINEIAGQVSAAAQQTQATAMHLAEASDHQAHQITAASGAINEMAVSIDQVSRNAEESSQVAQQAVKIALKGTATVKRTIGQMDATREQIQETSKRIKRLGESSQEIGNIVELINDIADQTNILALNASIQAAMAGESGRGFAVVADEVQRLAERSGNATKQIEALVKTIQTDTNEAANSMEQSTTGVVAGARQAEEAGEALREIENVSQHLAGLISSISEASRQQANAAGNISDSMNVIQEITFQTSAGTNETATSIGNLADLAIELRGSVAGFKLPKQREALSK